MLFSLHPKVLSFLFLTLQSCQVCHQTLLAACLSCLLLFLCFSCLSFSLLATSTFTSQQRILRSDNEYSSNDIKQVVLEVGMKVEKSTPYCPQQNGVAERMWGVLGDKVRSMLHWSGMPHDFWCHAYLYASRVRNLLPTRANQLGCAPVELFYSDGGHDSIPVPPPTWGCLAYVHIPSPLQQSKLDVRAAPSVFIGWSRVRKSGKYYVPAQASTVYSRSARHMNNTPGCITLTVSKWFSKSFDPIMLNHP